MPLVTVDAVGFEVRTVTLNHPVRPPVSTE
jgi:hypothetical protein